MAAIVCLGIAVWDQVFRVPQLPPQPQKLTASSLRRGGGGMAASAAAAAARLGGTVAFWGRLGDDLEGQALRAELQSYGVSVPAPLEAGTQTPTAAVLVADNGERLLAVFPGRLNDATAWLPLAQLAQVQAVLADFRWPAGASVLFTAARARRLPSVLDGDQGDPASVLALLPQVEHAVFSESGLAQAAGSTAVEPALRQMHERGAAVVGVTLGERGSAFLIDGVLHRVSAFAVQARDTNGAGDVFHGAYTLALAEGQDVLAAARFASAAAALKCRNGSGWPACPERASVQQLLKDRS